MTDLSRPTAAPILTGLEVQARAARRYLAERAAEGIDITFIQRTDCASCGDDTQPLAREWGGKRLLCPKCREAAWEREQEFAAEERYRARLEFRQRTRL